MRSICSAAPARGSAPPLRVPLPCCGLVPTPRSEDALRAVFALATSADGVRGRALARQLGVAQEALPRLLEPLTARGLLARTGADEVVLTPHGRAHARHLARRYLVLELFLVRVLGMTWDEAPAEADVLEHAVSDLLLERIDALLGRPNPDLRGDPIPRQPAGLA